jgi:hypothetical protein
MSDNEATPPSCHVTCACLNVTLFLAEILNPAQPEDAAQISSLFSQVPACAMKETIFSQAVPTVAKLEVGNNLNHIQSGLFAGSTFNLGHSHIVFPEFLSLRRYDSWTFRDCFICHTAVLASKIDNPVVFVGSRMHNNSAEHSNRRELASKQGYLGLCFDPEMEMCSAERGCRHALEGS